MSQEKILSDFSGGMNALAAVDKLAPNECLLAENVRLDETGNIASAGAITAMNTQTAYKDGRGNGNVHSLFWNPTVGAVAGVGQDVVAGLVLGNMKTMLSAKNPMFQKMSFSSAPDRVYFDVGSVGYWTDINNLLTVDWAPPSAQSAFTVGPSIAGTGSQNGTATTFVATWTTPNNVTSTASFASGTWTGGNLTNFSMIPLYTQNYGLTCTTADAMLGIQVTGNFIGALTGGTSTFIDYPPYFEDFIAIPASFSIAASLIVNGAVVGESREVDIASPTNGTFTLGGANDLWGVPWLAASQANASNFGVAFFISGNAVTNGSLQFNNVNITAYQQQPGFVAGTGTTGTLTGTYTWKITFVATNGEESDASIASTSVILSEIGRAHV